VQRRRLAIGDVPLGLVDYGGQFIVVILDNVPQYIPDEQVRIQPFSLLYNKIMFVDIILMTRKLGVS